jgi:hypothetical protein
MRKATGEKTLDCADVQGGASVAEAGAAPTSDVAMIAAAAKTLRMRRSFTRISRRPRELLLG